MLYKNYLTTTLLLSLSAVSLLPFDEGVGGATCAGATGTTDAVHVVFVGVRLVEIDDVADIGDVEAAGSDIGGDEYLGSA